MLVLTRKAKEEIRIGNDITVTIVRVKGQAVRVGIHAPEHVSVMRAELTAGGKRNVTASRCDRTAMTGRAATNAPDRVATEAIPSSNADCANENTCPASRSPIGSTTAFARVVARHRQNRTNSIASRR